MNRLACFITTSILINCAHAFEDVSQTVHNLSVTGPGPYRSLVEARVCTYCHTPHNVPSARPQWNRREGGGYIPYQSSTTDALVADIGSSRLCLSCHDGTIALGDMFSNERSARNRNIPDNLRQKHLLGRSRLGTDLRDDHPISIVYDSRLAAADRQLANPALIDLPLEGGNVECVTCHNPHSNSVPPFLEKSTRNGELCLTCHEPSGRNWDWDTSAHALSAAVPRGLEPWKNRKPEWRGINVGENACMNCHALHNAVSPIRLINDREEESCYRCHDGSVAEKNIESAMRRFFRHPVDATPSAGHDATIKENPLTMPFHVECEDCHNPHASRGDRPMISINPNNPMDTSHANAPFANKTLRGVSGIDINGTAKNEVDFEYELCFKCHGVPGKNACDNRRCPTASGYNMIRLDGTYNLRDKFDPGNPSLRSYHPVAQNNPNNDSQVPSLRPDSTLNTSTTHIYCGDCHAGNRSPAAGGDGPSGAHGSIYEGLLAATYAFDPQPGTGFSTNRLCFKCHDWGLLNQDISFPHSKHVFDEGASCINCHDPHGSAAYPHLINFLLSANVGGRTFEIRGIGGYPRPFWRDNGTYAGTCWLNCHGVEHDGKSYPATEPEPE